MWTDSPGVGEGGSEHRVRGCGAQSGEGAQKRQGRRGSCRGSRSSVPSLPDQGQVVFSEMILSGKHPEVLSLSLCLPTHHPEPEAV